MSILVDWQIKELIAAGEIEVNPFDESLINPNSLDVRLGGNFSIMLPSDPPLLDGSDSLEVIDPLDKSSFTFRDIHVNKFILMPNEFVLASLHEDITLPDYICAEVRGKSSLGRMGLDNSSCAGWIDAGWSGIITIELFNHGSTPLVLTKGMKIGQLIFHKTEKCEKPYGQVGRYQRQKPGTGSLGV